MNINRNNYEEFFLLYVDRELDDAGRQTVEAFVQRHPDLEKELAALKQTVALPPELEFENKDRLFRNEKKHRLVPLIWWRVAAALLIILAGAWFLLMSGRTGRRDGQKTPDTATALSAIKDGPAAPVRRAKNTVLAAMLKKSSGGPAVSPSTAVNRKLNPGEQSGRNTVQKTVPEPENNDQPAAASDNKDPGAAMDLPVIARQQTAEPSDLKTIQSGKEIAQMVTVRQPLASPPTTINQQPSTTQSILVFNNKNKTISGFFKKFRTGSSEDATAANNRQKITVSVFQFNLKK